MVRVRKAGKQAPDTTPSAAAWQRGELNAAPKLVGCLSKLGTNLLLLAAYKAAITFSQNLGAATVPRALHYCQAKCFLPFCLLILVSPYAIVGSLRPLNTHRV